MNGSVFYDGGGTNHFLWCCCDAKFCLSYMQGKANLHRRLLFLTGASPQETHPVLVAVAGPEEMIVCGLQILANLIGCRRFVGLLPLLVRIPMNFAYAPSVAVEPRDKFVADDGDDVEGVEEMGRNDTVPAWRLTIACCLNGWV